MSGPLKCMDLSLHRRRSWPRCASSPRPSPRQGRPSLSGYSDGDPIHGKPASFLSSFKQSISSTLLASASPKFAPRMTKDIGTADDLQWGSALYARVAFDLVLAARATSGGDRNEHHYAGQSRDDERQRGAGQTNRMVKHLRQSSSLVRAHADAIGMYATTRTDSRASMTILCTPSPNLQAPAVASERRSRTQPTRFLIGWMEPQAAVSALAGRRRSETRGRPLRPHRRVRPGGQPARARNRRRSGTRQAAVDGARGRASAPRSEPENEERRACPPLPKVRCS